MSVNTAASVSLPEEQKERIEDKLSDWGYASLSSFIRDSVRRHVYYVEKHDSKHKQGLYEQE